MEPGGRPGRERDVDGSGDVQLADRRLQGPAIATTDEGTFLYASNFHDGTVDVFDSNFHQVHLLGDFRDPSIPAGYAPFGIQAINGLIYVTYAEQDAQKHDDVAGPGHGFIDIFTTDGLLVKRLASRGTLNSPWGLARAPAGFGPFSGKLLAGNFGDGRINAFDQFSGDFAGQLETSTASPSPSMAYGGCVSAPRPPAAPPPCCSAPGSTTRGTGSWARSTPPSSPAARPGQAAAAQGSELDTSI